MLYLLLAIISSATISIVMRVSSHRIQNNMSMLAVNYLICAILGAVYAGFRLATPQIAGFSWSVGLGAVSGVLFLSGFLILPVSIRKNGMVLSSIFMKLGLLVPFLLSILFFHEVPTLLQIVGFCIAIGAIILINLQKGALVKGAGVELSLLLMGGSADATAKVYEEFGPAVLSDQFLFYTFAVAFLLSLILVIRKKERFGLQEVLFGTLIGIPNFFSTKFLLGALGSLPAVVVYPTFSVATLLVITLTGVLVFRERLSRRQWIALGAIIAALVLLNI